MASTTKEPNALSFVALAAPSEPSAITRIVVAVHYADTDLPFTTGVELVQSAPGEWSGEISFLPRDRQLRFLAEAFDAGGLRIFDGETLTTLTASGQYVAIPLAPAQDQETLPMPRLSRITYPSQIAAGTDEQFAFTVQGNAGQLITLQLRALGSEAPAAEFHPAGGAVQLSGTVANFMTVYTAPAVTSETPLDYQVTITADGIFGAVSITTNFRVLIKPRSPSGPNVGDTRPIVRFPPVISNLTANGTDPPGTVQLVAEVSDDSAPAQLAYQWSYAPLPGTPTAAFADGGQGNPGHLQGYTVAHQGTLSLAVSDEHGGTTTLRYPIASDQFADAIAYVEGIKGLTSGAAHTCVLTGEDRVRCWGDNQYGQLGYNSIVDVGAAPDRLPYVVGDVPRHPQNPVRQIAAGGHHTCALFDSGGVACWGRNHLGQLGYGHTNNLGDNEAVTAFGYVILPEPATRIAAGGDTTCAILESGALLCWGGNAQGQLGRNSTTNLGDDEMLYDVAPLDLGASVTVKDVVVGSAHTCALLSSGGVRCWGSNTYGQLGYGHRNTLGDNEAIAALPNLAMPGAVRKLVAGGDHTCALFAGGGMRCWGRGHVGQLGHSISGPNWGDDPGETPAALPGDLNTGGAVMTFAAGGNHTCALSSDEKLKCWGLGASGQLGYGDLVNRTAPPTSGVTLDDDLTSRPYRVTAGGDHTCALRRDGRVRCWGAASDGQLGRGTTTNLATATGNANVRIFPPGPDEPPPPRTFDVTRVIHTLAVPPGTRYVQIKAWGAGGGGGLNSSGGGGGFSQSAPIAVTAGELLTVIVGQGGGGRSNNTSFGGGGARLPSSAAACPNATYFETPLSGAGGGYSAVFRGNLSQATALLVAGGGGGGGVNSGNGGPGGGASGGVSNFANGRGGGGTQTAGGAGGTGAARGYTGAALQGGTSDCAGQGGGGGGGYFGGGGSAAVDGNDAGGGGGSGYAPGGTTLAGALATPPMTTDPDYSSGAGRGGAPATSGGNGRVVIEFF